MSESKLTLAMWIAGIIFSSGIIYGLIARMKKQIDGVGRKVRLSTAEIIIQSKNRPDFDYIVRRLLG